MRALLALSLSGCTEYAFQQPTSSSEGDSGLPGDNSDIPEHEGETDSGDDYDPAIVEEGPPESLLTDCADGTLATFSSPIYVLSSDPITATGELNADSAGWYHVYDYTIAESGASQRNETAYFRITNGAEPEGLPYFGNCGDEWLVMDADNEGDLAEGTRIYIGTFYLETGANQLTMTHFCDLVREGSCGEYELLDSDQTCDVTGNPNSVHFDGEGICLVPAK
ncbi:MAG: hypothetical protein ACI8RZ_005171 [Myxococcota bacterium]|jgi:hypothetical protein